MSQLANSQSERPKGILPSQPVTNPRNSNQVHLAKDQQFNQCNVVRTLRSGKKVDNKVSLLPNSIQHKQASTSYSSTPSSSDKSEKDKSTDQVHMPIVPFSNRLKTDKIHTWRR